MEIGTMPGYIVDNRILIEKIGTLSDRQKRLVAEYIEYIKEK